jgi:hypothetical protein
MLHGDFLALLPTALDLLVFTLLTFLSEILPLTMVGMLTMLVGPLGFRIGLCAVYGSLREMHSGSLVLLLMLMDDLSRREWLGFPETNSDHVLPFARFLSA